MLVVTHLPQVAACADTQVAVAKHDGRPARPWPTATVLDGRGRVVELSRMLSGSPDSATARRHAAELLDSTPGAALPPRRCSRARSPVSVPSSNRRPRRIGVT